MINRFATFTSRLSVALTILFTIAACGGGGGGGFIPEDGDGSQDLPAIATTALPNAIDGVQYTTLIEASGGKEPYSWAIVDDGGTGFTINSEGILSGIAPDSGDYGLSIQVTDNANKTDKASFILTVTGDAAQPLAIATTSLPNALETEEYSAVLEAVGGQGAYQWTLIDNGGSGLDLRPDGLLSGTAPGKGQYPITVAVQDDTREVSSILILTVTAPSDPLNITTSSLPGGTVGERYAAALQAGGGNPPYSWTLVSDGGSGLRLSSDGVLSGTPALGGTFGLVVRASDGTSTDQLALTLTIGTGSSPEIGQLRIETESLPDADRVLYAAALEAAGGVPPYSWTGGDTGSPGTGFTVDSASGSITGNTNDLLPGQYGYSVTVTDQAFDSVTRSYIIEVPGGDLPPVRIETPNPLPDATENLTYSVVMRAVGGGSNKTWRVVETIKDDGSLFLNGPDFPGANADSGVLFWSAGDIEVGNYLVTIEVVSSDADTSADVVTYNLRAIAAPIKITTATLPNASVGSDYITQLTFTGGGATRSWSVVETTKDGAAVVNGPTFAAPGDTADGKMFWSSADIAEGMYKVTIKVTSTNAGVTTEDTVTLDLEVQP